MWERSLNAPHDPTQANAHHAVENFGRDVGDQIIAVPHRIVDQNVDPPALRRRLIKRPGDGGAIRYVGTKPNGIVTDVGSRSLCPVGL